MNTPEVISPIANIQTYILRHDIHRNEYKPILIIFTPSKHRFDGSAITTK